MDVSINKAKKRVQFYDVERVDTWEGLKVVAARQNEDEAEVERLKRGNVNQAI